MMLAERPEVYKGIYIDNGSSIGPVDGMYKVGGTRLKGFINTVVSTNEQLSDLAATLKSLKGLLHRDSELSRLTFRVLVRQDLVNKGETFKDEIRPHVEAVIPRIRLSGDRHEYSILYLGSNKEGRRATAEDHAKYAQNTETASLSNGKKSLDGVISGMRDSILKEGQTYTYRPSADKSYSIKLFEPSKITNGERTELARLLATFGYDQEATRSVIEGKNSIKAVAYNGVGIACLAVAEMAEVPLAGRPSLKITEITDAVVRGEDKGNQLYFMTSSYLLTYLLMNYSPDIVYGESNLKSIGVLKAALEQGRSFSTDVSPRMGAGTGILEKHAIIGGELSSLVVTFFDSEQVADIKRRLQRR